MKLNVPEVLKVLLVDDWEAITKNNQVRCSLAGCMCLSLTVRSSLPLVPLPVYGLTAYAVENVVGYASSDAKRGRNPPTFQRARHENG